MQFADHGIQKCAGNDDLWLLRFVLDENYFILAKHVFTIGCCLLARLGKAAKACLMPRIWGWAWLRPVFHTVRNVSSQKKALQLLSRP